MDLLTVADKFKISYKFDEIFDYLENLAPEYYNHSDFIATSYLYGNYICYNVNKESSSVSFVQVDLDSEYAEGNEHYQFKHIVNKKSDTLDDVGSIYAFMSSRGIIPWKEFCFNQKIGMKTLQQSVSLKSYGHYIKKLKWPYIDACINYTMLNYMDQSDAY